MKWLRVATAAGLVASLARAQRRAGARPCGWHRDGSSGGGSFGQVWPNVNYRATVNDNMLVTVMIETLEGVANAEEIAATHGVDVLLIGNNDLSSFSGWPQNDPRYQDALVKVHDAALKYGKYFGLAVPHWLLARSGDTCRPDLHTDSPHQHKCHAA